MFANDNFVGLFKVNLVATLVGKNFSPGSPHLMCLASFLDAPISFPLEGVVGYGI